MKIKRVLIIVIPFLFLFSLIFFATMPKILQRQEQDFQSARKQGWTTYFEGEDDCGGGVWGEGNKIITDAAGKIWIAGGGCLSGLNVFDGTAWSRNPGWFSDLALSPQGEILAVRELGHNLDGIVAYDGQDETTYYGPRSNESSDNTTQKQQITQVEVDGNGRIWVVMNDFGVESISEMSMDQDEAVATFSQPELTVKHGRIKSLDADSRGNVWVSVWNEFATGNKWTSGQYVFDGEDWEKVSGQGLDLQVVQTAFDKQGNVWVATTCGGVMMYDGKNWTTILPENTDRDFNCRNGAPLVGITLDNQDRVWVWSQSGIKFLDGVDWVSFSPENSGFAEADSYGASVLDVMIDDLDQVWIVTSGGVRVSSIEDIQPLPEEVTSQNEQTAALTTWLQGRIWLIPSLLALLWLALYFNMSRSIVLALIISLFLSILMGPLIVPDYGRQAYNPLLIAIIFGMLGGLVGGLIYKTMDLQDKTKPPWDIMVMIFGFVVAFVCRSVLIFGGHP